MNLNENWPVSPSKREALLKRIQDLRINVAHIQEGFARGSGKGGQKRNKTSNAVILTYAPFNIVVRMDRERQRSLNRFLALRELVDQIEVHSSPHTSRRLASFQKIRKQKDRRKRRAKI